jgi:glutathione peroxidase
MKKNPSNLSPATSFYQLSTTANNGNEIKFENFRGRKVLLVNTASECGFTPQYNELEKLHEQFRDKLVVLGFPSNDFGEQERGNDAEIASFCKKNYEISFPLAQKSSVAKGSSQNKIFEWLSHKNENGWNEQEPTWNFSKYLVNENGVLTHYFEPSLSPLSNDVIEAIRK